MGRKSFREKRRELVRKLISDGILRTPGVIRAFLAVPREEFVLPEYRDSAYGDYPLPILKNQTISAPHMCAIMCEALGIEPGNKVLEVGTGSGYHAALCAEITCPSRKRTEGYVLSVEIYEELAEFAKENLERTGYDDRVFVVVYDGSQGAPTGEEFDRILVTAAAPRVPQPLVELLAAPGKMVIPVGTGFFQELVLIEKDEQGNVARRDLGGCIFVPLRGKYGYRRTWCTR